MLGLAKEAEVMCEWMKENNRCIDFYDDPIPKVILESRNIRIHTLYVMIKITEEFSAAAAAGHKIGREEPATTNGPGCNGNSIDTEEAANTNGGCIPDIVNSQDQKIKEDDKCRKVNMEGEGLFEKLRVWERLLLPYAFAGRTDYNNYLEKYYSRNALRFVARATANRNPEELLLDSAFEAVQIATTASSDLAASVSISCLKMEEALLSELKPQGRHCLYGVPVDIIIHSRLIKERVLSICGTAGEVSIPSTIAFVCITKEAELMTELLKLGAVLTDEIIEQTSVVRICALGLANLKGHQSIAAAAAMVGMAKETGIMLDWIKRENKLPRFSLLEPHELEEARLIRIRTLDVMMSMLQESSFPS